MRGSTQFIQAMLDLFVVSDPVLFRACVCKELQSELKGLLCSPLLSRRKHLSATWVHDDRVVMS